MGEIIVKDAVIRKKGFLYYIDREGNLCEAEMKNVIKEEKESARKYFK